MGEKVINLTPHDVVIRQRGKEVRIPSSGVIRLKEETQVIGEVEINGMEIPLIEKKYVPVEFQPEPDKIYLVSTLVKQCFANVENVIVPDTGSTAIRDENGRIVAVTRLTAKLK